MPHDDNTPQGRLARGQFWLIGWIAAMTIGVFLAQLAQHWWHGTLNGP